MEADRNKKSVTLKDFTFEEFERIQEAQERRKKIIEQYQEEVSQLKQEIAALRQKNEEQELLIQRLVEEAKSIPQKYQSIADENEKMIEEKIRWSKEKWGYEEKIHKLDKYRKWYEIWKQYWDKEAHWIDYTSYELEETAEKIKDEKKSDKLSELADVLKEILGEFNYLSSSLPT